MAAQSPLHTLEVENQLILLLGPWLPDGHSQIFRSYVFGPSGFWTMASPLVKSQFWTQGSKYFECSNLHRFTRRVVVVQLRRFLLFVTLVHHSPGDALQLARGHDVSRLQLSLLAAAQLFVLFNLGSTRRRFRRHFDHPLRQDALLVSFATQCSSHRTVDSGPKGPPCCIA